MIHEGERFLKDYPNSKVIVNVLYDLGEAYQAWWSNPGSHFGCPMKPGGEKARLRAIQLYKDFLEKYKGPQDLNPEEIRELEEWHGFDENLKDTLLDFGKNDKTSDSRFCNLCDE